MNVLDLFSGIGGFSLGLERAGMRTVAFCEIDPYCRKVLARHWPAVPCYDDIRTLTASRLRTDGIVTIDAICGGFPCQDISLAGAGAGLAGERSGLWRDYARIIGEVRPRYVIVENVAALLARGLGTVLGDLAALGYDAEWHCLPASAVGAPHRRDRIWIMADARSGRCSESGGREVQQSGRTQAISASQDVADASQISTSTADWRETGRSKEHDARSAVGGSRGKNGLADAISTRQSRQGQSFDAINQAPRLTRQAIDAFYGGVGNVWRTEPDVGRVANGVPFRLDRLRGLGNAVVPQIPEIIGRAIMRASMVTSQTRVTP